ncbi:MAG TPA: hypothetical protein VLZ55_06290 [Rhodanobacter sp.]|jgi:hypothetical protein|nr:hypothetical protein [Rhodanobacter sp.]
MNISIQGMLLICITLFAIAAAGGLVMAGVRAFGQRNPPAWLALLHGLLAGAGLTLLLLVYFVSGLPALAAWALLLFIVAAAGGVLMNLGYQWQQKPLPLGLMYGHAVIAVIGFVLLVCAAVGA